MILKGLNDYDICNYKEPSMFIIFPSCSFKCDKENGNKICQNSSLIKENDIEYSIESIVNRYILNPLTNALVLGGLEPFDSYEDLKELIYQFREKTNDIIIIYTGYYENEINDKINYLKKYENIIIKFGRYVPNSKHLYDELLGIELASNNQYSKKIS